MSSLCNAFIQAFDTRKGPAEDPIGKKEGGNATCPPVNRGGPSDVRPDEREGGGAMEEIAEGRR